MLATFNEISLPRTGLLARFAEFTVTRNAFARHMFYSQLRRYRWEKRQFLALNFCCSRWTGAPFKNLSGALYTDKGGCTSSVRREVEMETQITSPTWDWKTSD
jgi:hypothetical protein